MRERIKQEVQRFRVSPGARVFLRERLRLDPDRMDWDVLVDLTQGCNLSCTMCLTNAATPQALASPAVIERILAEVVPRAADFSLGCRSEPLLHPDLPEILARLGAEIDRLRSTTSLVVLTSGTLLGEGYAERLATSGVHRISLSIESTEPEKYARIRKGGAWSDVEAGIRRLLAARSGRFPGVGVQAIVSRQNLTDLPRLLVDVARLGLDRLNLPQLIPDRPSDVDEALSLVGPEATEVQAVVARLLHESERWGVAVTPPQPLLVPVPGDLYPILADSGYWDEPVAARDRPAVCIAPWSRVRVDHLGDVYPCHRALLRADSWGNLLAAPFASIVNSPKALAMREALLEGRVPCRSCGRCPYGPAA